MTTFSNGGLWPLPYRATPADVSNSTTSLIVLGPFKIGAPIPSVCRRTTESRSKAIMPRIPPVPKRACCRKALTRSSQRSCRIVSARPSTSLGEIRRKSRFFSQLLIEENVFRTAKS